MNKYTPQQIEIIRRLRSEGKTYSEICEYLKFKIPKGSMSAICREVELPPEYYERFSQERLKRLDENRNLAVLKNKAIRALKMQNIKEGVKYLGPQIQDNSVAKIALAMLYLGEGSKKSSGLSLGNSDSRVIQLYIHLLNKCYGIQLGSLKARICHRADQDLRKLTLYWSQITGISVNNFYRSIPDPRTKNKPTLKTDYMGVCTISCKGADIVFELSVIADIILENLNNMGL